MLIPDGYCFSFDHRYVGYGPGECVATVVVKRLSDALEAGDAVRAIIRSTAVGQDGRAKTIASPSSEAQLVFMGTAYEAAGLDPAKTCYVEAHGTGTVLVAPLR